MASSLCGRHLGDRFSHFAFGEHSPPFLVFAQRRQLHLRLAGVGAMHGLAVVPKRLLREPFGITRLLRPFRPGVAVGMQSDALDFEADTSLMEFRRPVAARTVRRYGKSGPSDGRERRISAVSSSNRMMAMEPVSCGRS